MGVGIVPVVVEIGKAAHLSCQSFQIAIATRRSSIPTTTPARNEGRWSEIIFPDRDGGLNLRWDAPPLSSNPRASRCAATPFPATRKRICAVSQWLGSIPRIHFYFS